MDDAGELSEQQRLAIVAELRESHPHLDLENALSGALLGPASPERPDIPPWEYGTWIAAHPEVTLQELTSVRFPVRYLNGESSVTSIDEHLRPLPRHLSDRGLRSRFELTANDWIDYFRTLHDAGVISWNRDIRGIEHLLPLDAHRAVLTAWGERLTRRTPRGDHRGSGT